MKSGYPARIRFCERRYGTPDSAFSLFELFVVIAVLAVVATTQLPALTRAKTPVKFTQCQNNLRQIGQAVMLYKTDNDDGYPFGNRCRGAGTYAGSVIDPNAWPMQLLRYLGGYETNTQPAVYTCPSEDSAAAGWVFQVHYQVNRCVLTDNDDLLAGITGAMVRRPSIYWMFIEKDPGSFCNIRPGGLANPVLMAWNYPPGFPGYRRHNGGTSSVAADGHVEWLRTPPYQPGRPAPDTFLELGDCASGLNPSSTWLSSNDRVKLFSRYSYSLPTF